MGTLWKHVAKWPWAQGNCEFSEVCAFLYLIVEHNDVKLLLLGHGVQEVHGREWIQNQEIKS